MEAVYKAIEDRFGSDAILRRYGRKLYRGQVEDSQAPRSYVCLLSDNVSVDPMFAYDDLIFSLRFQVRTRLHARYCMTLLARLRTVYHECTLTGAEFGTVHAAIGAIVGPEMVDGVNEGSVPFTLHVSLISPVGV